MIIIENFLFLTAQWSMKASNPEPIDRALATLIQELGIGSRIKQLKVLDVWAEVVGEHIAKVTRPDRIERGKLVVHVKKATWRNELTFLKKDIIAKLNQILGEEIVKEIIFR